MVLTLKVLFEAPFYDTLMHYMLEASFSNTPMHYLCKDSIKKQLGIKTWSPLPNSSLPYETPKWSPI